MLADDSLARLLQTALDHEKTQHHDIFVFRRTPPQAEFEPAWPSDINPCRKPDEHTKSTYYLVGQRVTRLCSQCLWDRAAEILGLTFEQWRARLMSATDIKQFYDAIPQAVGECSPDPEGSLCQ